MVVAKTGMFISESKLQTKVLCIKYKFFMSWKLALVFNN